MEHNLTNINKLAIEEQILQLKESFKNIRKIAILEKLPFKEWTKDELLELLTEFDLWRLGKLAGLTTIRKFVKDGTYRKREQDFEEFKEIGETITIRNTLQKEKEEVIRNFSTLKDLKLIKWTKRELLRLIDEYDNYVYIILKCMKNAKLFTISKFISVISR